MDNLQTILAKSGAQHHHLCPRQILGVRIGISGAAALELRLPRDDKRLLIIAETDGCFVDGLIAATGCTVGHRTLRIEDYGKIAATFVDVKTGRALRVVPRLDVRERAGAYAPGETRSYFVQMQAYQVMPCEELVSMQEVALLTPVEAIVSRAGVRTSCATCGEEIINEREVIRAGTILCRTCAGEGYYQSEGSMAWVVRSPCSAPLD
jgi:formylmethanofuran dehydrogenase subunit E